ncbi:hypothetical protein KAFR_0C01510 [Kazachstania africana CBS 2517]|uniref:Lysophospholipase n=1 Tax=Kazachstania africana (strain ATCC 22294 / BCRC 22015 / CBS 2517 / CECT 1963 / NBRC 1671 / NRRL Y-8276) TaxID=1071382 RepID=H2ARZ4_KAZAF|nr:hypothetical protein KAFR_0C01510 [Kazachstania africana CBS 2517]CCF57144.1 hypothetical protein KAFR_0C01510 [Kazachstania africana CBS 2517]
MHWVEYLYLSSITFSGALALSPSGDYAPAEVVCESGVNLLREASGLSSDEKAWLEKRDKLTEEAMKSFLTRATANFSDTSILEELFSNSSNVPKIGFAASGGGYRAMLNGAGMLSAFDNRTRGANEHGYGGLLQAATYLSGLSGGNWLVGTLAWNNWTSVQDIVDDFSDSDTSTIWDLEHSLLDAGGWNWAYSIERWAAVIDEVRDKKLAGFNVSLVDVWGRALSYYFFPDMNDGGDALTWSSIRDFDVFKNAEMPFPISVADELFTDSSSVNLNSTVFEFNPFEMGSWDETLNAFTDVKYLGTEVSNGEPVDDTKCVEGFDNTGFILGSSSDVFNLVTEAGFSFMITIMEYLFLGTVTEANGDEAKYGPNPFKDSSFYDESLYSDIVGSDTLYLVDGSEDGQNIPLLPLITEDRALDVVFAFDNSADTSDGWPDGASLVSTYERQFGLQGKNMAFPYVPDTDTFVNLGLNKRPTFFGCDASNLTDLNYIPPLIVYIPNSEYSYESNTLVEKLTYSTKERIGMIRNGFETATRGNFTEDSTLIGCMGCAIMRRKQESTNATLPTECESCFNSYCWNGTIAA